MKELLKEYRILKTDIEEDGIKANLKKLTRHIAELEIIEVDKVKSIEDVIYKYIDDLDRCVVLIRSEKDLNSSYLDMLLDKGNMSIILLPKRNYRYIFTDQIGSQKKITYLLKALDYLDLEPKYIQNLKINEKDFYELASLNKKAKEIEWNNEIYNFKEVQTLNNQVTYYVFPKSMGNFHLMTVIIEYRNGLLLNRVHYPSGIHPFVEGTGAFQEIMVQLAEKLGMITSGGEDRTEVATNAWRKILPRKDFEIIRKGNVDAILYKKGKYYYDYLEHINKMY